MRWESTYSPWRRIFAWFPHEIEGKKIAWLEFIERCEADYGYYYRSIGSQESGPLIRSGGNDY